MKEKIKTLCLGLFGILVFAAFAAMLVAAAVESIVHALQSINAL